MVCNYISKCISIHSLISLPLTSHIVHHVECVEQGALEVREGEGKNKGSRGDGGKTRVARREWCLALKAKDDRLSSPPCISHILLRHSRASLKGGKMRGGGRMGGESETRERQQKAGGGGSVVASAGAVILLLRGSAAGGCAEGRSVEKTEERRTGEKERKGAPGQQLQLQQPVRTKERRKRRLQDCLKGSILCWLFFLHREKGLSKEA